MSTAIHILIIEDEAVLAMDLNDLLEEEGYLVVGTAKNGRKVLQLHQERRIDLALCDISIKGDWDGVQTVEHLLTERTMITRPMAYLVKPITVPGLRAAIKRPLRHFVQPEPSPAEAAVSCLPSADE